MLGQYLLHAAAGAGKAEHVRALIAAGHNVNAKGPENDETPVHLAAASGHDKALQLLLDAGADLNAKDWVIFLNNVMIVMQDWEGEKKERRWVLVSCDECR